MVRRRVGVMSMLLGLGVLVFTGCSFLGKPTGQDRTQAKTLEQEIADYKSWETPDWLEGFQGTQHPLPEYVKYYVNDIGMSDIDNPPNGSVFVKEQYDEDKQLINFTVMKKVEGYDPENKDWYWAIADEDGDVTHGGKLNSAWTSRCIDCHKKGDGGSDLLFIND